MMGTHALFRTLRPEEGLAEFEDPCSVTASIMVGCPRSVTMKVKFELTAVYDDAMTGCTLYVGDDTQRSFIVTLFRVLGFGGKISYCKVVWFIFRHMYLISRRIYIMQI